MNEEPPIMAEKKKKKKASKAGPKTRPNPKNTYGSKK
jgi:hypothetical protein